MFINPFQFRFPIGKPRQQSQPDVDDRRNHAIIAQASYSDKPQRIVDEMRPGRYELLEEFSNSENSVFLDKRTDKVVFGIRGTDPRVFVDIEADSLLSIGLPALKTTGRYKRSRDNLERVIEKYGKDNITMASHSLGAAIASDLSNQYKVESFGFNRGGTSQSFKYSKASKEDRAINHLYFTKPGSKGIDILSIGTSGANQTGNVIFLDQLDLPPAKKGLFAPHSLGHFIYQ